MSKTKFEHDFRDHTCIKCHYTTGDYPYTVTQPCTLPDKKAGTLEELLKQYWGLLPPEDRDFFKNPNAYNNRMKHREPYRFQVVWLLDELQDFIDRKMEERDKECKEGGHIILRGEAGKRMYEVLKENYEDDET